MRVSSLPSLSALASLILATACSSDPGTSTASTDASSPPDHEASRDSAASRDAGSSRDGATHDSRVSSEATAAHDASTDSASPLDATHRSDAASIGDAGAIPCGCNGKSDCAVWKDVYITWYGYNDNSCGTEAQHGCNDIADPGLGPKMHTAATEGAGTYDDPSTAASSDTMDPGHVYETSGQVTLAPGTLIYNPEVQQYFIMEDSCLECGDEYACKLSSDDTDDPSPPAGCTVGTNLHIDFWMGPNDAQQPSSLDTCENNATIGNPYAGAGVVIVNPPPNLPVKPTILYGGGTCFTSQQVSGDSCP